MFVFDTSAYINGWKYHYPFDVPAFSGVWILIRRGMEDGTILSPRAVLLELQAKEDDVYTWANTCRQAFVDPIRAVQRRAGEIHAAINPSAGRDEADAWVIAEAEVRLWTVVTYEGLSFDGTRHKNWDKKMPGVCQHFSVTCVTLPEAITQLSAASP